MKTAQLQDEIRRHLAPALSGAGFAFNSKFKMFMRRIQDDGVAHFFYPRVTSASAGVGDITPEVAIRVDKVENLFHRAWGTPKAVWATTFTIASPIYFFSDVLGMDEFHVAKLEDVPEAVKFLERAFNEVALSYYARYSSIAALDHLINDEPEKPSKHIFDFSSRCNVGLILAKLAGRKDPDQLYKTYRKIVERLDDEASMRSFEETKKLINGMKG